MSIKNNGYYAVIFTSKRSISSSSDDYSTMAHKMLTLAKDQEGFLGVESARNDDGFGITISYWQTEEAIQKWKSHLEHKVAQDLGIKNWYEHFSLRVSQVIRETHSDEMFIGEIILESLIDISVLKNIKHRLVSEREAQVKNFIPSHWHIQRYKVSYTELKCLIPKLENNFDKNQWYIHFYSLSTEKLFVILPGQSFELSKYDKNNHYQDMIAYGESVGVGRRWTENIPVDFYKEG